MDILAFIPARSGSKRVLNKNIKLLNDKPLIAYTIDSAKNSKQINRTVVSTDSIEIAEISKKHGAETPFMRPSEISQTNSTEMEFFKHSLNWFKTNENYVPDLIVLLYPTAPFRKVKSIDSAIEKILAHPDADSLRSVKLCSEHPYKMWRADGDYLKPYVDTGDPNTQTLSYQLLPKLYIQNANIYITKPETILKKNSPIGNIVIPFIMDEYESIDINTELDFSYAELLMKHMEHK